MKFPSCLEKVNDKLALLGGILIACIAVLSTMEVIMRRVLHSPTDWSLNVSQYILIWAIFLAAAPAIQQKAHVSVDFIRDALSRRFGSRVGTFLGALGYLASLIFIVVICWQTVGLFKFALKLDTLSMGTIQIPIVYLYAAMLVGTIFMALTTFFIILNIVGGSKD